MPPVLLGLVLGDSGRPLARALLAVAGATALALLLAIMIPVALLAGPGRGAGSRLLVASSDPAVTGSGGVVPAAQPHTALPPASTGRSPVEVARHYLGVPYVFGGSNPAIGLDCSGLVQLVFQQLGLSLPRTAQLQYDATVRVPQDQLQPGDLVFFARTYADPHDWITHVGIYIGDGLQINAPTEGQVVSIQPVFSGYWGAHYASGGRPRRG